MSSASLCTWIPKIAKEQIPRFIPTHLLGKIFAKSEDVRAVYNVLGMPHLFWTATFSEFGDMRWCQITQLEGSLHMREL